jgi:hypothetical protein
MVTLHPNLHTKLRIYKWVILRADVRGKFMGRLEQISNCKCYVNI